MLMEKEPEARVSATGTEGEGSLGQLGTDSVVLKILLPERETGHVIGKGGSVLTKIKADSGARIRISGMDEVLPVTRERICTIVGTLPAVLDAQKRISNALVDNAKAPTEEGTASQQRTLKLLLSHAAVGCVIGRGGALIKGMMDQTGAQIKASQPSELIQATNERWLSITGSAEAVETVVGAIMQQILASPATQQLKELDYSCLKHAAAAAAAAAYAHSMPPPHGWPHHPRSAPMMPAGYGAYPMGAPPQMAPPRPGGGNAPMNYKQFMGLLDDNVSPEISQQKYSEYLRAFGAAAAASAAGGGGAGPQVAETMTMSDKLVSGVIGKGGAVIRELMARSGAQIQVSQKGETQGGERVVTMSGSVEAVAMAQHFVKERLKEIEAQTAARAAGGPLAPPAHQPPPSMAPPQSYGQQPYQPQPYMQQGYSPTQPSPFMQHHSMPPGMPLTMPQSSMTTMFSGQPSQFTQWQ